MIETWEIYWAAGFIEGEGSFAAAGKYRTAPVLSVSQVNPEPLYRLKAIFGGSVNGPYHHKNPKHEPFFRWVIGSIAGVEVMMTILPLMSEKRQQQIKRVIEVWREAEFYTGDRTHCPQGHEYTKENTYVFHGHWRDCIECRKHRRAKWRAKQKPVDILDSIKTENPN